MTLGHRLVIDIQTTQSQNYGERGIPRYTSDLCRALLRAGAPVEALAMNPVLPHPRRLHPELARAPQLCWNTSRMFRCLDDQYRLAYHVMSPLEGPRPVQSAFPPYVLGGGIPLVCTVYDMIPEIFKVFPKGSSYERLYLLRRDMMRRADLLMAISESTRRDAIELLELDPARVVNIGTGGSEFFRPPSAEESPEQLLTEAFPEITRPFVFAVTGVFGLDKRKNTEGLMEAFATLPAEVRREHQVVVTCRLTKEDRRLWLEYAAKLGFTPGQVVLTDFVPDVVLRALYQRAALFVYPSEYEGFGLPPLEAARCGCPTIVSNTSAMPEILEWEPATFSPKSRDEIAAVMLQALTDDDFRAGLRAAAAKASERHTWENVAKKAISAYGLLDPPRPRRRRGPAPLRVALVGPLPPTRSGVASYNLQLASCLAERCDLDCIAEGEFERPPTEVPARKFRVFPSQALGAVLGAGNYDTIFYSLANGRHHDETYELALRYPGIVWLHDVHLADLYLSYALARFESEPSREFMLNTLRHHYRERAREDLMQSKEWTSHAAYEQAGSRLSAELARRSRGAIVGSERALTALQLDAGPYAGLPPTWVVPLAVPPVPDWAGAAVSGGGDGVAEPLILTIGRVTPDSQPDLLLDAVAALNRTLPARLAFVGELADGHRENLVTRIKELGLEGRCELTGWVDADTYESWLRRAACVVQLRHEVSGASSVAVTDALAHGLPTITSHGAAAEFPEGTARVVSIDAGPAALAEELRAVLTDAGARERLKAGALAYAKSWTFDDVADRLVDIAQADSTR